MRKLERSLKSRVAPAIRFLSTVAIIAGIGSGSMAGVPPRAETRGLGGGGDSNNSKTADGTLLVDSFETLLKDRDIKAFRARIETRYTEEALTRILASSPDVKARRAAALAAGLSATFRASNAAVAKGLKDSDPAVRNLTEGALWSIWFRASTSDNNKTLEEVSSLIGQQAFDAAIDKATKLIEKAPDFAEAYNQRAIAHWQKGELAKSIEDCLRVLDRNPYHFGALTGMAGCYSGLGEPRKMLSVLRRAQRVRPHDAGIAATIRSLEQELGPDSGKSNSEGIEA